MIAVWAAAAPFLPATVRSLDDAAVHYVVLPDEPDQSDLAQASDAEALIVGGSPVTAELLGAFDRLRLLVRAGVGVDRIDMNAATRRGVAVTNVSDYARYEVADHTLLLMLAATRQLTYFRAQASRHWLSIDHRPVMRLQGRRLGIIGLGRIGTAVTERAQALGMEVVAHDPGIDSDSFARARTAAVPLDELLATSNVISLHAPLTPDSHHILDQAAFDGMQRSPVVINTARGGLIDTAALIRALDTGAVSAAGLDVLEEEPDLGALSLLNRDDVIITPHVAWYSQDSQQQLGRTAAQLALDFVQHRIRPHVLNPEAVAGPPR